jgi:hypothetical protein
MEGAPAGTSNQVNIAEPFHIPLQCGPAQTRPAQALARMGAARLRVRRADLTLAAALAACAQVGEEARLGIHVEAAWE